MRADVARAPGPPLVLSLDPVSRFQQIRDPALRLALLSGLHDAGRLDLSALPKAARRDRINPTVLRALLRLPVTDEALAGLAALWWEGGGHRLQHLIWPLWHGEDDTFYVHDLTGVEALPRVRELVLATDAPLEPLLALPALQKVRLCLARGARERGADVLAALRARKVAVQAEDYGQVPRASSPRTLSRGA